MPSSSYPKPVFTLVQNMFPKMGTNPNFVGETEFYMIWNAILNTHFPAEMGYGISFHKTTSPPPKDANKDASSMPGNKPSDNITNFLVVKLIGAESESTVLVVAFKRPTDDTTKGRTAVEDAAKDYIVDPGFDETEYPEIYSISSVGLSWTASKMEEQKSSMYVEGKEKPDSMVDWTTNMTSALSFDKMKMIAGKIHSMTHPWRRDSKNIGASGSKTMGLSIN